MYALICLLFDGVCAQQCHGLGASTLTPIQDPHGVKNRTNEARNLSQKPMTVRFIKHRPKPPGELRAAQLRTSVVAQETTSRPSPLGWSGPREIDVAPARCGSLRSGRSDGGHGGGHVCPVGAGGSRDGTLQVRIPPNGGLLPDLLHCSPRLPRLPGDGTITQVFAYNVTYI